MEDELKELQELNELIANTDSIKETHNKLTVKAIREACESLRAMEKRVRKATGKMHMTVTLPPKASTRIRYRYVNRVNIGRAK
jgi:hypothetical protein